MGRKIKPRHLKRDRISISLDLEVLRYLDNIAANKPVTRSRYIESLVRKAMLKGQATLSGYLYRCKICAFEGANKKPGLKYCRSCQDMTLYSAGKLENFPEWGEEE